VGSSIGKAYRFLADQVGVATADTFDLGEGVHDFLLAVDIGVEEAQDELEVRFLSGYESCKAHGLVLYLTLESCICLDTYT